MPSLTTSLSSITPRTWLSRATASGVEPWRAKRVERGLELRRRMAALVVHPSHDRVARALAQARAVEVDAAHPRLRGERDEVACCCVARARGSRTAWRARRSSGPRGSRRRATTIWAASASVRLGHAGHRHERGRLAVAERDRPGLVEEQDVDVARGLDRPAREGEDVATDEAVHAGDADGRQQRADRGRDERDEERDECRGRGLGVRRSAKGPQRDDDGEEDPASGRRGGSSAISFGVLRRSAPSTSAIMRSRKLWPGSCVISTTMRSDSTRVPPVTAERSPPDSRITGADSPVIADSSTDAIPSTTVPSPGMSSPVSTTTRSPRVSSLAARCEPSHHRRDRLAPQARNVAACALPRPSAIASAKLPNTTVSHSHTATVTVYQAEVVAGEHHRRRSQYDPDDGRDDGADLDDEHHRVAHHVARVELADAVERGPGGSISPREQRTSAGAGRSSPGLLVIARLRSRTLTPGSPNTPSARSSVLSLTSARTLAFGIPRHGPRHGRPGCGRSRHESAGRHRRPISCTASAGIIAREVRPGLYGAFEAQVRSGRT